MPGRVVGSHRSPELTLVRSDCVRTLESVARAIPGWVGARQPLAGVDQHQSPQGQVASRSWPRLFQPNLLGRPDLLHRDREQEDRGGEVF